MWPFKKNKEEAPRIPLWWEEIWEKTELRFPVGTHLKYLGLDMVVTQHDYKYGPILKVQYASKCGEVKCHEFAVRMFQYLLDKNP